MKMLDAGMSSPSREVKFRWTREGKFYRNATRDLSSIIRTRRNGREGGKRNSLPFACHFIRSPSLDLWRKRWVSAQSRT
ncbi:hypothetical protein TNCV_2155511 [Trichonephila clavipes]|nr:hypothetical protein TNCV_2155511 [Trichonephila clavipes]